MLNNKNLFVYDSVTLRQGLYKTYNLFVIENIRTFLILIEYYAVAL